MPPLVEAWETFMPGTKFGPFFTSSEGTPAKVILSVQLVRVVIIYSVGKQIVPRPLVVDLNTWSDFTEPGRTHT